MLDRQTNRHADTLLQTVYLQRLQRKVWEIRDLCVWETSDQKIMQSQPSAIRVDQ